MGFIYESSILKDKTASYYQLQKLQDSKIDSITGIFNTSEIPKDSPAITPAEAGSNGGADDTDLSQNNSAKQKQELDIKSLEKKYKKNPADIIEELGFDFTDAQKAKLASLLKDKKDLSAVLQLASEDSLNADDILAGMEKVSEFEGSGFFKRIGNSFKTLFKDGVSEAIKLIKSEKEYYSDKLSGNMDEIRTEREDFSSQGLANIADKLTQKPEIKESTMHFVEKDEIAGKKLYSEESVTKAAEIMYEKPHDALEFMTNAVELESIKNENGQIKYKGETIINIDEKMIDNKDLQPTMLKTAQKEDMNDDYLIGITDNLVENPDMDGALNDFLDCKDKDGNDRFSAKNIFDQSSYMQDKDETTIDSYRANTLDLASHDNLSGDNIVTVSNNITDHPEIKDSVYSQINSGIPGDEIASNSSREAGNSSDPSSPYSSSSSTSWYQAQKETQRANEIAKKEKALKQKTNNPIDKSKEEVTYTKNDVLNYLYKKYGSNSNKIYQLIKENRSFVSLLKKYNGNIDIINALVKDPKLVEKVSRCSASITNDQLGAILKECTNTEKTEMMISLISSFGPMKALTMASQTKASNCDKKILDILNISTIDSSKKKEQIEDMLYGVGENRQFSA